MKFILFLTACLVLAVAVLPMALKQPEVSEPNAETYAESRPEVVVPEVITAIATSPAAQTPVIVEGIEVYGLTEPIDSPEKFNGLKQYFNQMFEIRVSQMANGGPLPADEYLKRDLVWGRNTRVLEVVVRKSDYFNDPLGGSFVQRMKIELDLMTRLMESSLPASGLSARLARVVVVDDQFTKTPAWWPIVSDVDHSEFIGGDEAGSKFSPMRPGEFVNTWSVNADAFGNVNIEWDGGEGRFEGTYYLPAKGDSVLNLTDYLVSYYRIHELWHRLFNLPDEYIGQIRMNAQPEFLFQDYIPVGGQFTAPEIQPFISYLAVRVRDYGVRGTYHPLGGNTTDQNTTNDFSARPDTIRINVPGSSQVRVFTVDMNGGYYAQTNPNGAAKTINPVPGQDVAGSALVMDPSLFSMTIRTEKGSFRNIVNHVETQDITIAKTVYVIQANFNGVKRDLAMPVSVFVMSKLAGYNDVTYDIVFADARLFSKTLYSKAIRDVDVQSFFANGEKVMYASTKIVGTDYTMVWFQQKPIRRTGFAETLRPTPAPVTVVP